MNAFRVLPVTVFLLLASLAAQARAGTIVQPVGVTSSMGEQSTGLLVNLINQTGLSAGYTSGVTDFDVYVASNPTHAMGTLPGFGWLSGGGTITGTIDFDLGSLKSIESMALWNMGGNVPPSVKGFNLLGDADGDFSSGAISLLNAQNADPNLGTFGAALPQVFGFAPTSLRFVRLQITSNNGQPNVTGAGEVAFEEAAAASLVPEPSSLVLLGTAALGLIMHRRRKTTSFRPFPNFKERLP